MPDQPAEIKRPPDSRESGEVLAVDFRRRGGAPAVTTFETARSTLDRLQTDLREIKSALSAALKQLAVTAPQDKLRQNIHTTAELVDSGFVNQLLLLEHILNP